MRNGYQGRTEAVERVLGPTLDGPLALERRLQLANARKSLDQDQQDRLLELERCMGYPELLNYLSEQLHREQEMFWARFGAFAAIHAGALVLVTSDVVEMKWIACLIGLALAAVWMIVQLVSLAYADGAKQLYHWYRRSLGILWEHERPSASLAWLPSLAARLRHKTKLSSTDVALAVPILIALLWSFALFQKERPKDGGTNPRATALLSSAKTGF